MKAWIASRRRLRSGSTTWSWMASNPGGTRSGVFVDHYPVLAIRKLAVEATDNGLLAPELAAGIARVKKASGCARETGCRSNRRRQLPNAPDITTTKALRDRAIIAVLLNGLLAPELAAGIARVKSAKSIGVRSGHWLTLRQPQAPPERAEHHDQRGCATAPSSPCYSAVRCADLRWLRLRWGHTSSSGMAGGASWISSASTGVCSSHGRRGGSRITRLVAARLDSATGAQTESSGTPLGVTLCALEIVHHPSACRPSARWRWRRRTTGCWRRNWPPASGCAKRQPFSSAARCAGLEMALTMGHIQWRDGR